MPPRAERLSFNFDAELYRAAADLLTRSDTGTAHVTDRVHPSGTSSTSLSSSAPVHVCGAFRRLQSNSPSRHSSSLLRMLLRSTSCGIVHNNPVIRYVSQKACTRWLPLPANGEPMYAVVMCFVVSRPGGLYTISPDDGSPRRPFCCWRDGFQFGV